MEAACVENVHHLLAIHKLVTCPSDFSTLLGRVGSTIFASFFHSYECILVSFPFVCDPVLYSLNVHALF